MLRKLLVFALVTLLSMTAVNTALAQDSTPQVLTVEGVITLVNPAGPSFDVQDDNGITTTVHVPEGFDLSGLMAGDRVEVQGVLNEAGAFEAVGIVVIDPADPTATPDPTETAEPSPTPDPSLTPEPSPTPDPSLTPEPTVTPDPNATPEPEEEGQNQGYYCTSEDQHPVGGAIAVRYEIPYEDVKSWFCSGYGFGQIMLALQTSQITEIPAADLLQMKKDEGGWGQVWHELGVVRNQKDAQPPAWGKQKKNQAPTDVAPTDSAPVVTEVTPVDPEATPIPTEEVATPEEEQDKPGNQGNGQNKDKDKNKGNNGNNGNGNGNGNGAGQVIEPTQPAEGETIIAPAAPGKSGEAPGQTKNKEPNPNKARKGPKPGKGRP